MKKLFMLILVFLILLPLAACKDDNTPPPVDEGPMTTLIVHYHRFDGDYEDWDLWVWPQNQEGKDFAFDGQDSYGVTAEVKLVGNVSTAGIVVRRGGNDWEGKDITWDRFIEDIDGSVEIWLLEGDPTVYFSLEDVPK